MDDVPYDPPPAPPDLSMNFADPAPPILDLINQDIPYDHPHNVFSEEENDSDWGLGQLLGPWRNEIMATEAESYLMNIPLSSQSDHRGLQVEGLDGKEYFLFRGDVFGNDRNSAKTSSVTMESPELHEKVVEEVPLVQELINPIAQEASQVSCTMSLTEKPAAQVVDLTGDVVTDEIVTGDVVDINISGCKGVSADILKAKGLTPLSPTCVFGEYEAGVKDLVKCNGTLEGGVEGDQDTGVADKVVGKKKKQAHFKNAKHSKNCHVCNRPTARFAVLRCSNITQGTCRKVVCQVCFGLYGWDWKASNRMHSQWTCCHCNKICPSKSTCSTYKKTNDKISIGRKIKKGKKKKTKTPVKKVASVRPGLQKALSRCANNKIQAVLGSQLAKVANKKEKSRSGLLETPSLENPESSAPEAHILVNKQQSAIIESRPPQNMILPSGCGAALDTHMYGSPANEVSSMIPKTSVPVSSHKVDQICGVSDDTILFLEQNFSDDLLELIPDTRVDNGGFMDIDTLLR